jgi:hypothetical protein
VSLCWKCKLSSLLLAYTFHQLGFRAFSLESKPQQFFLTKIRNVMSVLFNHACRYEFFDQNPVRLVRQSAKRRSPPVVLTPGETRTLLEGLKLGKDIGLHCLDRHSTERTVRSEMK